MIKFENTDFWGFEHALRGMRNPLNSWDKSDSDFVGDLNYIVGPKDMGLAQRLIAGGPEHRKLLRQIFVSVDITAPLYWWKEFDTYKVGTVANSCSTMHTIHKKKFEMDDFSCEHLGFWDPKKTEEEQLYKDTAVDWNATSISEYPVDILSDLVIALNHYRKLYLETNDKKYWWQMIQLLPSSYNQKRTVTLDYENLRSIYFQRKNHKLDEWREGFIGWIKSLPYAEELIIFEKKEGE